jgi:hypothetical protein
MKSYMVVLFVVLAAATITGIGFLACSTKDVTVNVQRAEMIDTGSNIIFNVIIEDNQGYLYHFDTLEEYTHFRHLKKAEIAVHEFVHDGRSTQNALAYDHFVRGIE